MEIRATIFRDGLSNYRYTGCIRNKSSQRLEQIIHERNSIHSRYQREFTKKDIPVRILEIPQNVLSALHLCIIRLMKSNPTEHEQLFDYMRRNGVGVQLHYSPIHLQPYYREMGFKEGDFPNSELFEKQCLSIPIYPGLKTIEQDRVIDLLESFLKKDD